MFTLKPEPVEDESLKPIQFIAPGLLGWAVAMGGDLQRRDAVRAVADLETPAADLACADADRGVGVVAAVGLLAVAFVQMAVFLGVGAGCSG